MSERGGSVGKGHKFRVSGMQETGRRKRDAGSGTQETVEGAGANEVSGSPLRGKPLRSSNHKKKKRPTLLVDLVFLPLAEIKWKILLIFAYCV